jgi:iron complex outermembrane receptor protein
LSMSFAKTGFAEDVPAVAPIQQPSSNATAANRSDVQPAAANPGKGGVTSKMLDEVSVTATREARTTREVPQAIAVVGKDKIEKKRMFNLKEALEGIPGVQAESKNGGSDVRLFIRGAGVKATYGVREIMVLRDGVPVTDPDSLTRLDFIDMQDIERVEVTKGPGSIYSTGSFGGAIQIISKSVFDKSGNVARVGAGEQGAKNLHLRYAGMVNESNALAITTSFRKQDNPWRVRNVSDSKQMGFKHGLLLDGGATLESELTYANSKMQLPGGMDLAGYNNFVATGTQTAQTGIWQNSKRDSRTWSFNTKYEKEIGDWTFKPRVYANWWKHYHPVTGIINDTPNWTQTIGTDIEGQLKHSLGGMPSSLVAGVTLRQVGNSDSRQYQYRDVKKNGAGQITATTSDAEGLLANQQSYTDTVKGIFLQESLRPSERWLVDASMRYDQSGFSMTTNEIWKFNFATGGPTSLRYVAGRGIYQTDKSYNLPSSRLGVTFKSSETVNVYASIGRSNQLPANGEISSNPNLIPATSVNYEVGMKARADEWFGNVAVYNNNLTNEIVTVYTGGAQAFVNAGKTRKEGLELDGGYLVVKNVEIGAQFNYSNYHYTSFTEPVGGTSNAVRDGNQLPFIPKDRYGIFAGYKDESGFSARLQSNYSGAYYTDNANSQMYGGYRGVITASLAYEKGPHLFNLSAENLTNKYYAMEVSKTTGGVVTYSAASPRVIMLSYALKL